MTLYRSELNRFVSRRATRVAYGAAALGLMGMATFTFLGHSTAEPDLAAAQLEADKGSAECREIYTGDDPTVCEYRAEWFVHDERFHYSEILGQRVGAGEWSQVVSTGTVRRTVADVAAGDEAITDPSAVAGADMRLSASGFGGPLVRVLSFLAVFSAAIGATLLGADWRSGVVESQLVRVPNRWHLFSAKFAAVSTVTTIGAAALAAIYMGALIPSAVWRGDFGVADTSFWLDAVETAARAMLMAGVFGTVGAAIAHLARNTVAGVVATLVAYGGSIFLFATPGRWIPPLRVMANIESFIGRADVDQVLRQPLDETNISWVFGHSYLTSGLILAGAAAVLMFVSGLSFARRDIS